MWLILSLVSSVFLSLYDILRKASLKKNAVIPVLFISVSVGAVLFAAFVFLSRLSVLEADSLFYVPTITAKEHLLFALKSVIVGSSWFLAYFALKNLPLTFVMPIRSTGPLWTLIGALIIFGERFTTWQWIGITTVLIFFYIFSLAGQKEGIHFFRNKWVFAIIGGTILGAISGMYDKYLLMHYDRMAVQSWFSIYMIPVFLPFLLFLWYPNRKKTTPFQWRWSILFIGLALAVADFNYFYALSYEDSLIAIVSVLRRSSVIISFMAGALIFKEQNLKRKALALVGILIGIGLIIFGTTI